MTSHIYQQRPTSFAWKPFVEPGKCSEYTLSIQKVLFSDLSSSLRKKAQSQYQTRNIQGFKVIQQFQELFSGLAERPHRCRSRRVCVGGGAGQDADTFLWLSSALLAGRTLMSRGKETIYALKQKDVRHSFILL